MTSAASSNQPKSMKLHLHKDYKLTAKNQLESITVY